MKEEVKKPKATIKIEYYGAGKDGGEDYSITVKGKTEDLVFSYMGITAFLKEKVKIPKEVLLTAAISAFSGSKIRD